MSIAEWNEDLVCGHPLIDRQHQHLFNLINSLDESLHHSITHGELELLLADLMDYTQIHFRTEEEIMRSLNYPHYLQHRRIHEQLTKQVMDLRFRLKHGENDLSIFFDVSGFLADWLEHHIQASDRQMINFIKHHSPAPQ